MKRICGRKQNRTEGRDLFDELVEGMNALADERQGKRTLTTNAVALNLAPK